MAPSYRSIDERNAGREAMFEKEAESRAELRAGEINEARQQQSADEEESLNTIAQARESGFRSGHRSATADTTRFFSDQGFIPSQVADQADMEYERESMMEEEERAGLGASDSMGEDAVQAQADDISSKLLEASMQGARQETLNQTIDQLNVPDQVKQAAAQMFLQKQSDVQGQAGSAQGNDESSFLSGSAVERKNSPVTKQAFGIVEETEQRMQQLHQLLNPQQG